MTCRCVSGLALLLLGLCAGAGWGAAEENVLKRAKAGDWAEFACTVEHSAGKSQSVIRETITAKDAKFITLSKEVTANGTKTPPLEECIALDEPLPVAPKIPNANVQVEKGSEGDETLTIGEKEYKCHWVEYQTTTETGGQITVSHSKIWSSREAPVKGIVKMVNERPSPPRTRMTLVLTGGSNGHGASAPEERK